VSAPRSIVVRSHEHADGSGAAVRHLVEAATAAGVEVHVPPHEVEKHGIEARDGVVLGGTDDPDVDLAVVLGGDGSILGALRAYAGRDIPVFAFNFGAIGFLATVDHGELEPGIERILSGDWEVLGMPALAVQVEGGPRLAVNDISVHRRADLRVAELAYSIEGEELGQVRCDGLVASTPVGSTGYNLANGGPVLAWGVEGFVVSFIAPHSLTARALVVATDGALSVQNRSERDEVDVTTDGRIIASLGPLEAIEVRFRADQVLLAQLPGRTFYSRLREKFGRLAY
jgi:NAD+ kinase